MQRRKSSKPITVGNQAPRDTYYLSNKDKELADWKEELVRLKNELSNTLDNDQINATSYPKTSLWYHRAFRPFYKAFTARGRKAEIEGLFKRIGSVGNIDQFFGLRGHLFGKYLTDEDRFNYLAAFAVAAHDLNKVLKFKKNQIGLGHLALSFGARGRGSEAHYEPETKVINLARYKEENDPVFQSPNWKGGTPDYLHRFLYTGGVGALSHEYGHYLDYIVGEGIEPHPTQFTLSGGPTVYERPIRYDADKYPLRYLVERILEGICLTNGQPSNYIKRLKKLDITPYTYKYLRRRNELFARIFELYVSTQLKKQEIHNIFLIHPAHATQTYPSIKELQPVLPLLGQLIRAIKQQVNANLQPVETLLGSPFQKAPSKSTSKKKTAQPPKGKKPAATKKKPSNSSATPAKKNTSKQPTSKIKSPTETAASTPQKIPVNIPTSKQTLFKYLNKDVDEQMLQNMTKQEFKTLYKYMLIGHKMLVEQFYPLDFTEQDKAKLEQRASHKLTRVAWREYQRRSMTFKLQYNYLSPEKHIRTPKAPPSSTKTNNTKQSLSNAAEPSAQESSITPTELLNSSIKEKHLTTINYDRTALLDAMDIPLESPSTIKGQSHSSLIKFYQYALAFHALQATQQLPKDLTEHEELRLHKKASFFNLKSVYDIISYGNVNFLYQFQPIETRTVFHPMYGLVSAFVKHLRATVLNTWQEETQQIALVKWVYQYAIFIENLLKNKSLPHASFKAQKQFVETWTTLAQQLLQERATKDQKKVSFLGKVIASMGTPTPKKQLDQLRLLVMRNGIEKGLQKWTKEQGGNSQIVPQKSPTSSPTVVKSLLNAPTKNLSKTSVKYLVARYIADLNDVFLSGVGSVSAIEMLQTIHWGNFYEENIFNNIASIPEEERQERLFLMLKSRVMYHIALLDHKKTGTQASIDRATDVRYTFSSMFRESVEEGLKILSRLQRPKKYNDPSIEELRKIAQQKKEVHITIPLSMKQLSAVLASAFDAYSSPTKPLDKLTDQVLLNMWAYALAANAMLRDYQYPPDAHQKAEFYRLSNARVLYYIQKALKGRKHNYVFLIFNPHIKSERLSTQEKGNQVICDKISRELYEFSREATSYGGSQRRGEDWMRYIGYLLLDDLNKQINGKPLIKNKQAYATLFFEHAKHTIKRDRHMYKTLYVGTDFINKDVFEKLLDLRSVIEQSILKRASNKSASITLSTFNTILQSFKKELESAIVAPYQKTKIAQEQKEWVDSTVKVVKDIADKTRSLKDVKRYFLFAWRVVHIANQKQLHNKIYYGLKENNTSQETVVFHSLRWMLEIAQDLDLEVAEQYLVRYEQNHIVHIIPTLQL